MRGDGEPVEEAFLGQGRPSGLRVYLRDEMVWVSGYRERVGLQYGEALRLLDWLEQHRAFLVDRAVNYYECRECGQMHRRSQVCPLLAQFENGNRRQLREAGEVMNTQEAYWHGRIAASEKYLLTFLLLNMEYEEQEARRQMEACKEEHEVAYWRGMIDGIRDLASTKARVQGTEMQS
jgi:hypothetical protein